MKRLLSNRGQRDCDNIHRQRRTSRNEEVVTTNISTQKPSPDPPTLPPNGQIINQTTMEKKPNGIRRYRSRAVQKKSNAGGDESADLSNQETLKSNTQQHLRQQRGRQKEKTKETRRKTAKTRKTPGYTSSRLKKVKPLPAEKDSKLARNTSQHHGVDAIVREKRNDLDTVRDAPDENRDLVVAPDANCDLPAAIQIELNALIEESPKPIDIEQPVNPTAGPTFVDKISNAVNYNLIYELIEEAFFLCGECSEVLCQGELQESEHSVQVDNEISESMNINRMPNYDPKTENFRERTFREKTKEVIEFTKALEEEVQIHSEETKVKVEQVEVNRLNKLLPRALWMFLNNERRQEVFTTDHIRSLLRLHFDEDSFARKSTGKRDDLLAELEKINDQNPDLLQVAARLYL